MEPIQHLMTAALRTPMPERQPNTRTRRLPRLSQLSMAWLGWRRPVPQADCG